MSLKFRCTECKEWAYIDEKIHVPIYYECRPFCRISCVRQFKARQERVFGYGPRNGHDYLGNFKE